MEMAITNLELSFIAQKNKVYRKYKKGFGILCVKLARADFNHQEMLEILYNERCRRSIMLFENN